MEPKKHKILLVEDNPDIQNINQTALRMKGYVVLTAQTLEQARAIVTADSPDLIVLDIMLPDGNGLSFCEELRGGSKLPILFLSALGNNSDIIAGLTAGGDDYLGKPYDIGVLAARIEALLRREGYRQAEQFYSHGDFKVDFQMRRVYFEKDELLLKNKEYTLLEFLIRNRHAYHPTRKLYEAVWGMDAALDVRTVKTHIYGLRRAFSKKSGLPCEIIYAREKGYRFLER